MKIKPNTKYINVSSTPNVYYVYKHYMIDLWDYCDYKSKKNGWWSGDPDMEGLEDYMINVDTIGSKLMRTLYGKN